MTDQVTLTLTLSEAKALNALALRAAYGQCAGLNGHDMGPPKELNPRTTARAVDKLQRAALPDLPDEMTLTYLLKDLDMI